MEIAEPRKKDEASHLKKWLKEQAFQHGDLSCPPFGPPKLVLDDVAGRVYLVKTEEIGKEYYCVVGHNQPELYRTTSPHDILAYHRGLWTVASISNHEFLSRKRTTR